MNPPGGTLTDTALAEAVKVATVVYDGVPVVNGATAILVTEAPVTEAITFTPNGCCTPAVVGTGVVAVCDTLVVGVIAYEPLVRIELAYEPLFSDPMLPAPGGFGRPAPACPTTVVTGSAAAWA
jgi:hypothetical protein